MAMPWWLAIALVAFGAAIVATGLQQSRRARSVRSWTRMPGKVLEARIEEQSGPREQDFPRWRFAIRYGYEARGQSRVSDQIWIGSRARSFSQDRDEEQRWVDRFPAGADVTVWVDPADARQAVLVPEIPRGQVGALVVAGMVLAGIGLWLLARPAGS
jgi:hypothetical protein